MSERGKAAVHVWKFTVIGGAENGNDFSFPAESAVVVGRSHTADVRLSASDVSGRHLEFFLDGSAPSVRVLSRFPVRVNGAELASGAETSVKGGDTVGIGARMRLRIDDVPRIAEPDPSTLRAPMAMMEESVRTETGLRRADATSSPDRETAAMAPEEGTSATRVPEEGTSATRVPEAETSATRVPGGFAEPDDDSATGGGEDGRTCELETRQGSMEEILAMRAALARKNRRHKLSYLLLFLGFLAFLAGVALMNRSSRETDRMSIPKLPNGEFDLKQWDYLENGKPLLYVEYPGDDNLSLVNLPGSNGVQVLSHMGRERDVPFFLHFEVIDRPGELQLDLVSSVRTWIGQMEQSGLQCLFDENELASLTPKFFEDEYPRSCEKKTLYGVRFVRLEYKRPWPSGEFYHGVLIYFRRGSTVFVLRREIPDGQWVRGGDLLLREPNLAVYSNFSKNYWESPGTGDLPLGEKVEDLLARANVALSVRRASDWPQVKRVLDAALVKTWEADPKRRDVVMAKLADYRELLRVFYEGQHNRYETPRLVENEKTMQSIRRNCLHVFQDKTERYWWIVSKEW